MSSFLFDGPAHIHNAIRGVNSAFERLAAGVARIQSIASSFTISARCTVQRSNFLHLSETVTAARELGLTSISFLAADVDSQAFHRPTAWPLKKKQSVAIPWEEFMDLDLSIEELIASGECGGIRSRIAAEIAADRAPFPRVGGRRNV